mgnify:CR=1 FL=1
MNCIEVISVRAADTNRIQEMIRILEQIQHTGTESSDIHMKLYTRSDLEGDVSVYLFHDHPDQLSGKSRLGHTMADLLSGFGHVSHSIWLEKADY